MALDDGTCWRAFTARDRRFDGRFFAAVRTTHIYCRPGCPARMPARANVSFYPSAAAAENAGFRPCRRCRPDAAPGSAAWIGAPATVARALRLLEAGALRDDDGPRGLESLAARVGVSGRRLRQLFEAHVGAPPRDVARTHRAHLARRLLEGGAPSLEDVALASGFGSARRLRAAFQATFRTSPAAFRAGRRAGGEALTLRLTARAPFDPAPLLAFLAARAVPGVEQVADGAWRRSFALGDDVGVLEARPDASGVTLSLTATSPRALQPVAARTARVFDLDADVRAIAAHLRRDRRLARHVPVRGLRIPGAWDPFEHGVRALLGQQVSVAAARTLAGRVAARAGRPLPASLARDGVTHAFPSAAELAAAGVEGLGLTRSRTATLQAFANDVASGALDLASAPTLDDAVARLVARPGIGDWTAHYMALRGLGEPDAFPAGDLGVRKALARAGRLASEREARAAAEAWRPWRGYAVFALWQSLSAPTRTRRSR